MITALLIAWGLALGFVAIVAAYRSGYTHGYHQGACDACEVTAEEIRALADPYAAQRQAAREGRQ